MLDRGLIQWCSGSEEISEIELELERGDTAAPFELALALATSLPLQPAILAKAERGYRLLQGAQPEPVKADASPVHAGQSPEEAFRSVAAACLLQLQLNELGAESDDPEFIHQMRAALRAELPERIGQLLAMKRFPLQARQRMRPGRNEPRPAR